MRKTAKNGNMAPVIFLTSCDDEESITKGLDIGGDDYITKPFRMSELMSRISANLRRQAMLDTRNSKLYTLGTLSINFNTLEVKRLERIYSCPQQNLHC